MTAGSIAFPGWSEFDEADLGGLDDQLRAQFSERAIPSAGCLATEEQKLTDDRRLAVPVTMVCPEYTSAMLMTWITSGEVPVAELTKINEVEYLDLPTGHWPQLARPDDLAEIILGSVPVTSKQFVEADGLEDWRIVMGACAYYSTTSFSQGVALAAKLAPLADTANHRLDVDLRYEGVTVTISHGFSYFTHPDVDLARQIADAARAAGAVPDPSMVQALNVMFHPAADRVRPFWQAALGWSPRGDEDLGDPRRSGPNVQFFGLEEINPGEP